MIKEALIKTMSAFIFLLITRIFAVKSLQHDYGIQSITPLRKTYPF